MGLILLFASTPALQYNQRMRNDAWYIRLQNYSTGPYDLSAIRAQLEDRFLTGRSLVLKVGQGNRWLPASNWPELADCVPAEIDSKTEFPEASLIYREKPKQKLIDWGSKELKRLRKQGLARTAERHLRALAMRELEQERLRAEQERAEKAALAESLALSQRIEREAQRLADAAAAEENRELRRQEQENARQRAKVGDLAIPERPETISLEPKRNFNSFENDLFAIFDSEVRSLPIGSDLFDSDFESAPGSESATNKDSLLNMHGETKKSDSFVTVAHAVDLEIDEDIALTIADRDRSRSRARTTIIAAFVATAGALAAASYWLFPDSPSVVATAQPSRSPAIVANDNPSARPAENATEQTIRAGNLGPATEAELDATGPTIVVGRDSIKVRSAGARTVPQRSSAPAPNLLEGQSLPQLKQPTRPTRK